MRTHARASCAVVRRPKYGIRYQCASYGDGPDRRSRTGYIILMCGAAIVWGSRLQTTVALSTVEAEYMSLAAACQELLHVRQLLKSLGIKFSGPFKMFEDNTALYGAH